MADHVTVRVPATTANMGPGFDCLAMALDIWNSVSVELEADGFDLTGEGADTLPRGTSNMVYRGFQAAWEHTGSPVPQARFSCHNRIPLARGLGSSSAAVVAGLVAGNSLNGNAMSGSDLLDAAAGLEGHPDNVAAALVGGCQIVVSEERGLRTSEVPLPSELRAVVYIPETPMPTSQARGLLESRVDRADAVFNIGRVALLVKALATGELGAMAGATEDRLHQPARQTLFPAMKVIIRAAMDAGALGAFLSGAGSSVLALTTDRSVTIGYEMAEAASKAGVDGTFMVTSPAARGAHLVSD